MNILLIISLITLILLLTVSLILAIGIRKMFYLKDIPQLETICYPKVSIIIPALNEEKSIRQALNSILKLDYNYFEIIVVDDRSTDGTGPILDELAKQHLNLKIVHITHLKEGWLGKNQALDHGAKLASGEYLLFTDADVTMEESTLKRAIYLMKKNNLDHLSMFFDCILRGSLLPAIVLEYAWGLILAIKPWEAKNPASRSFMGIGAFNLVKKSVYQKLRGHQAIAMCSIDDIMLGKLIKRHGFRQECIFGYGYIAVPWYSSVKDMVKGLQKNTFAGYDYNLAMVIISGLLLIMISIWPLMAILLTTGNTRAINGIVILVRLLSLMDLAGKSFINPIIVCWTVFTPFIQLYIILKAVTVTLINQGISWKETCYPLSKLKKAGKLWQDHNPIFHSFSEKNSASSETIMEQPLQSSAENQQAPNIHQAYSEEKSRPIDE